MGVSNQSVLFCAENHFQFKSVEKVGTRLCIAALLNPGNHSPLHNNTSAMVKVHSAGLKAQVW